MSDFGFKLAYLALLTFIASMLVGIRVAMG